MLRLYHSRGSVALASLIALEEAGADYEPVRIDLRAGDQMKPEYQALNPKGRAPVLVTDQGPLTETPAILGYVAETHPRAGLMPTDAFERARMHAFNAYLCSTVHPARAHAYRGYRWAEEESSFADMRRKAPKVLAECYDLIEREMLAGPWVMGAAFTVADGYLYTLAGWMPDDGMDIARWPKVRDHFARTGERPAVRRAVAIDTGVS